MSDSVGATPRMVVFAGSVRRESLNAKLARVAADQLQAAGAEVHRLHLSAYPAPLYDADLEAESGLPETVVALKQVFAGAAGFVVVSPEYNASLSPLLKNTLDWMSRRGGDAEPMLPFRGKVAGLLAASPGRLGGLRGLVELRRVLSGLGVLVAPEQYALHGAGSAFAADGSLREEAHRRGVARVVSATLHLAGRLS